MSHEIIPGQSESPRKQKWSFLGKFVLLALPILFYLFGYMIASETKNELPLAADNTNIYFLTMALASFLARFGGIVMFILALLKLLAGPSPNTPSFMIKIKPETRFN
mgnify:CR=1 FL=1